MNILIAGSDGYIGRNTTKLLSQKCHVSTIGFYDKNQSSTFSGDLTDPIFVDKVVRNCPTPDVLIFLVGLAHKKGKGAEYDLFEQVNLHTLINLINGLDQENKLPGKIIFASTVSVYGERSDVNAYTETTQLQPFSPYAVTKQKAEEFLIQNYPDRSYIFRFAPVYSPDFMLNIERRAKIGSYFYKVGNGESKLSLCNIKNIQNAIDGVIKDLLPAGIYNISDPKSYTYNDLLKNQGASVVLRIPAFVIRLLFILGKITNNIFLKENSIKLITDNIFSSDKIRTYIDLPGTINDVKFRND